MIKNKKTILLLIFILAFNLLSGCSKETGKEKELDMAQIESGNIQDEGEEEKVSENGLIVENEGTTEEIDSIETKKDTQEEEKDTQEETQKDTQEEEKDAQEETQKDAQEEEKDAQEETQKDAQEETQKDSPEEEKKENQKETDKQNINKNNTEKDNDKKNNSGQSGNSNNNVSQKDKKENGIDKGNNDYIAIPPSSNSEKEKTLAKGIVKKIIKNGMSDFEKVKAINDYMIQNVNYDIENYKNNTIPAQSYTALGAMEKKVAVCSGYAKMFQVLAIEAGLDTSYITGDTPYGYHAWNQVKVDGKWYNIDVTWNDPDCETNENGHYYCGCYQYFLLSNEDFNKSHRATMKTNATGSSRDFEAFKLGCPYDGAAQVYETQEDIDKLVKEMVASNVMKKRIITRNRNKEELVINALKKQGIYANYEITIKDYISIYRETNESLCKITIDISLGGLSYKEAKSNRVTSMAGAKKILEGGFKKYKPSEEDGYDNITLYVNSEYKNNIDFQAEIIKWACYEKKMKLYFIDFNEEVDKGIYRIRVSYCPMSKDDNPSEIITSTKDMEAAIKRMFEHGYKKISLGVFPSDYKFAGESNAARNEFNNKFCKKLCEKYCLEAEFGYASIEDNSISVTFFANGHNVEYQDWEIQKEATCVSDGLEVKICRICNKPGEEKVIPKNDNHSYHWEQKGDSRTQKCELCSSKGITEVCYGGVWGYFDVEESQKKLQEINDQRGSIRKSYHDYEGNPMPVVIPPALVMNNDLVELAKERLVVLNETDFESYTDCEEAFRATPYSNTYQKKYASATDIYHEKYVEIGIICFKFDYSGDATKFGYIYVMELELAEEYKIN